MRLETNRTDLSASNTSPITELVENWQLFLEPTDVALVSWLDDSNDNNQCEEQSQISAEIGNRILSNCYDRLRASRSARAQTLFFQVSTNLDGSLLLSVKDNAKPLDAHMIDGLLDWIGLAGVEYQFENLKAGNQFTFRVPAIESDKDLERNIDVQKDARDESVALSS